jgi:hypothetical protein
VEVKLSDRKKREKEIFKLFFSYQIPFFIIGIALIIFSVFLNVETSLGMFLFIIGAVIIVIAPPLSIYLVKRKISKDKT